MSVLKGLRRMFGHQTVEELDGEIDPTVAPTMDRRDPSSAPDRPTPSPSIAPLTIPDRLAEKRRGEGGPARFTQPRPRDSRRLAVAE